MIFLACNFGKHNCWKVVGLGNKFVC
uniref:Uncharacterized protein n=1 Tax=Rhizophora mucronata TaxID=61149 RepID=A0A2P2PW71_RHIMU